jgi:hypothetical protein
MVYAIHMPLTEYGYHARELSQRTLSFEFAQPNINDPITDMQVYAACAYIYTDIRIQLPALYHNLLTHPLPPIPYTHKYMPEHWQTIPGQRDRKSDVDPAHGGLLATRIVQFLRTLP